MRITGRSGICRFTRGASSRRCPSRSVAIGTGTGARERIVRGPSLRNQYAMKTLFFVYYRMDNSRSNVYFHFFLSLFAYIFWRSPLSHKNTGIHMYIRTHSTHAMPRTHKHAYLYMSFSSSGKTRIDCFLKSYGRRTHACAGRRVASNWGLFWVDVV